MSAKFAAFRPIFVIIDGNVVHVIEWTDYNRISSVFKAKESSWSVLPSAIWSSWRPCLKRDTSGKSVSTHIHTHVSVSKKLPKYPSNLCLMGNKTLTTFVSCGSQVCSTTMRSKALASVNSCPPTSPFTSTSQPRRCRRS